MGTSQRKGCNEDDLEPREYSRKDASKTCTDWKIWGTTMFYVLTVFMLILMKKLTCLRALNMRVKVLPFTLQTKRNNDSHSTKRWAKCTSAVWFTAVEATWRASSSVQEGLLWFREFHSIQTNHLRPPLLYPLHAAFVAFNSTWMPLTPNGAVPLKKHPHVHQKNLSSQSSCPQHPWVNADIPFNSHSYP